MHQFVAKRDDGDDVSWSQRIVHPSQMDHDATGQLVEGLIGELCRVDAVVLDDEMNAPSERAGWGRGEGARAFPVLGGLHHTTGEPHEPARARFRTSATAPAPMKTGPW